MSEELTLDTRAGLVRGVVLAVDDSRPLQTVDVMTHTGVTRTGIEVLLPWGMVSVAQAGAIALLGAVGADAADMMAFGVAHPGARAGGGAPGTVGIADGGANRVVIVPGGTVEIAAATAVRVTVGGVSLTVSAAGVTISGLGQTLTLSDTGLNVAGNVTVGGTLSVTGAIHGTADHALHVP